PDHRERIQVHHDQRSDERHEKPGRVTFSIHPGHPSDHTAQPRADQTQDHGQDQAHALSAWQDRASRQTDDQSEDGVQDHVDHRVVPCADETVNPLAPCYLPVSAACTVLRVSRFFWSPVTCSCICRMDEPSCPIVPVVPPIFPACSSTPPSPCASARG